MPHSFNSQKAGLEEINNFLMRISETNESTEYSSDQENIVEAIIEMVRQKGRKDILEDFETPYIHHLITIQKWVDDLKLIANEAVTDRNSGERDLLFQKKIVEMNGCDVRQFIGYLKDDGLLR